MAKHSWLREVISESIRETNERPPTFSVVKEPLVEECKLRYPEMSRAKIGGEMYKDTENIIKKYFDDVGISRDELLLSINKIMAIWKLTDAIIELTEKRIELLSDLMSQ